MLPPGWSARLAEIAEVTPYSPRGVLQGLSSLWPLDEGEGCRAPQGKVTLIPFVINKYWGVALIPCDCSRLAVY